MMQVKHEILKDRIVIKILASFQAFNIFFNDLELYCPGIIFGIGLRYQNLMYEYSNTYAGYI